MEKLSFRFVIKTDGKHGGYKILNGFLEFFSIFAKYGMRSGRFGQRRWHLTFIHLHLSLIFFFVKGLGLLGITIVFLVAFSASVASGAEKYSAVSLDDAVVLASGGGRNACGPFSFGLKYADLGRFACEDHSVSHLRGRVSHRACQTLHLHLKCDSPANNRLSLTRGENNDRVANGMSNFQSLSQLMRLNI